MIIYDQTWEITLLRPLACLQMICVMTTSLCRWERARGEDCYRTMTRLFLCSESESLLHNFRPQISFNKKEEIDYCFSRNDAVIGIFAFRQILDKAWNTFEISSISHLWSLYPLDAANSLYVGGWAIICVSFQPRRAPCEEWSVIFDLSFMFLL